MKRPETQYESTEIATRPEKLPQHQRTTSKAHRSKQSDARRREYHPDNVEKIGDEICEAWRKRFRYLTQERIASKKGHKLYKEFKSAITEVEDLLDDLSRGKYPVETRTGEVRTKIEEHEFGKLTDIDKKVMRRVTSKRIQEINAIKNGVLNSEQITSTEAAEIKILIKQVTAKDIRLIGPTAQLHSEQSAHSGPIPPSPQLRAQQHLTKPARSSSPYGGPRPPTPELRSHVPSPYTLSSPGYSTTPETMRPSASQQRDPPAIEKQSVKFHQQQQMPYVPEPYHYGQELQAFNPYLNAQQKGFAEIALRPTNPQHYPQTQFNPPREVREQRGFPVTVPQLSEPQYQQQQPQFQQGQSKEAQPDVQQQGFLTIAPRLSEPQYQQQAPQLQFQSGQETKTKDYENPDHRSLQSYIQTSQTSQITEIPSGNKKFTWSQKLPVNKLRLIMVQDLGDIFADFKEEVEITCEIPLKTKIRMKINNSKSGLAIWFFPNTRVHVMYNDPRQRIGIAGRVSDYENYLVKIYYEENGLEIPISLYSIEVVNEWRDKTESEMDDDYEYDPTQPDWTAFKRAAPSVARSEERRAARQRTQARVVDPVNYRGKEAQNRQNERERSEQESKEQRKEQDKREQERRDQESKNEETKKEETKNEETKKEENKKTGK